MGRLHEAPVSCGCYRSIALESPGQCFMLFGAMNFAFLLHASFEGPAAIGD